MILLNFSHPITAEQTAQIEQLAGQPIQQVVNLAVQFDHQQPFLPQLQALVEQLPLTAEQIQSTPILVNPPSLNYITAMLLAELHGRLGYFPAILRIRPLEGSLPPRFEAAEILNLQQIRDRARKERY
ncbi:MAG: CRISPR-associated protein Csx15 [Chloroflexota bacterium]